VFFGDGGEDFDDSGVELGAGARRISSADVNAGTFGQITAQAGSNRVMQFALRYDF